MIDNIIDNLNALSNDNTIEIFKDLIQNFNLATINKYTLETYASMELEIIRTNLENNFNGTIYYCQNNTMDLIKTIFR